MLLLDTELHRIGSTYTGRELEKYCKRLNVEYEENSWARIKSDWTRRTVEADKKVKKVSPSEFDYLIRRDIVGEGKPKVDTKMPSRINHVSQGRKLLNLRYARERRKFLDSHPQCAVYPKLKATEIHHMKGRVGYADQWARENDIPLLVDRRFFLAVSSAGHRKITDNSKWALEMGYSLKRNE